MCQFTLATFSSCRCQLLCVRDACSAIRAPHHVCNLTDPIVSVEMNRACGSHANTITVLNSTEASFSSGDFGICEVIQHIVTAYERAAVSIPTELFRGELDRDDIRRKISAARCHLIVRESHSVTEKVFRRYADSGTKLYVTRCFPAGGPVNKETAAKANNKNLHGVKSGRVGKKGINKATACQEDDEDEEEVEERRRQEELERKRAHAAALKKLAANKVAEKEKEKKRNGRATKTGGIRRKERQAPTMLSAAAKEKLHEKAQAVLIEEARARYDANIDRIREEKARRQAVWDAQREAEAREGEEREREEEEERREKQEQEERLAVLAYNKRLAREAKEARKAAELALEEEAKTKRVAIKKARREIAQKKKGEKKMKKAEERAEAKMREEIHQKAEAEEMQKARWEEATRRKIEAESLKAAHDELVYRWTPRRVENLKKRKREDNDGSPKPAKKQRLIYSRPISTKELLEALPNEKYWAAEKRAKELAAQELAEAPARKAANELAEAQFALSREQLMEDVARWTLRCGVDRTPLPSTFSRGSGPLPYAAGVPFSLPIF